MPPHEGLTHLKKYDVKNSNVELIGSDIDHRVKFNSASTEPAWNNGEVGQGPGLLIWRIEDFEVVPWPKNMVGKFYDGDSYIVLHSYKVGNEDGEKKLMHDIFFWLGSQTSQDEAGTAAYKTVELDEFLHGVAVQHREIQQHPSETFLTLFPRIFILSGGVRSGFQHVDQTEEKKTTQTLLRIFKPDIAGHADSIMVHEVEPTWQSLDEDDVFVLDKGDKIWVWQGNKCSPMEKTKAAQVVHDLTLAKHVDVEVLSQAESRSKLVVDLLGGDGVDQQTFHSSRPFSSAKHSYREEANRRTHRLFRLSDASGTPSFDLVKDGGPIQQADFRSEDVFLLDAGSAIWVWQGLGASKSERSMWMNVAQAYIRHIQDQSESSEAHFLPLAKVVEGCESTAFTKALRT